MVRHAYWVHADRASGRDRDHRGSDQPAAAGRSGGPRGRPRAQCTNQLKQIGLAMHQYITDNDVLPPTGGVDLKFMTIGTGMVPQNSSIHLRLTNYLEQREVYDAYNFMLGDVVSGNSVAANTTVMSTSIAGYFCPSDANPGSRGTLDLGYSAPGGVRELRGQRRHQSRVRRGRGQWHVVVVGQAIPSYGSRVGLHRRSRRHQQHRGVQRMGQGEGRARTLPGRTWSTRFPSSGFGSPQQDVTACQAAATPFWDFKGEYWTLQDTGRGGPYYHIMPPNKPACNASAALRSDRLVHRRQLASSRRCERPAHGRLGAVRQGRHQPHDLACPGHLGRGEITSADAY